MTASLLQSAVFVLLAIMSPMFPLADRKWEMIVLGSLVVLLGIPHGALDTIYGRNQFKIAGARDWALFAIGYMIPVVLVVLVWKASPAVFLYCFLAISIIHFSGDPAAGTPIFARLLYGGAIVFLPLILHAAEVTELFSALVGIDAAAQTVNVFRPLAWPWLIGLMAASLMLFWRNRLSALEFSSLAFLATVSTPLLAFTVYFCAMHSARHIMRSYRLAGSPALGSFFKAALLPMLAVLVFGSLGIQLLDGISLETRFIRILFVTLAALTVPHMALVERFRYQISFAPNVSNQLS